MIIRDSGRRQFIKLAGIALAAAPFQALAACSQSSSKATLHSRNRRKPHPIYGPLAPINDQTTGLPLLWLPTGFTYHSLGWASDPLDDGSPTPTLHDGMATFSIDPSKIRIVRNHELSNGLAFSPELAYDPGAGAGTTTLELDAASAELTGAWPSLSGTSRNCAGGPTPWGSWLTCEETLGSPAQDNTLKQPHGYIFEVPSAGHGNKNPYRPMGRFRHEAVAVDPNSGIVYETEDSLDQSGFYRFVPNVPGELSAGGQLQMLGLANQPCADTRTTQPLDVWRSVAWIDIDDPDPYNPKDGENSAVFAQGWNSGGAQFARLEGVWYDSGHVYIVSTTGGNAQKGQIWNYHPSEERLRLLFESPGAHVLDMPDNICMSPRGGLVLCEDGDGTDFIHGLTADGQVFPFARNNVILNGQRNGLVGDFTDSEFAGITYSPDGRWLFFNIQVPGITFAVTGPWGKGSL